MIKSFTIGRRMPSLTRDQYLYYWKEKHAPLVAKVIPGVRKYVQNHPIVIPGFEFEMDGINEMWWDSLETYQDYLKWRQTDEARVLQEDEKKFSDGSRRQRFLATEHVIFER